MLPVAEFILANPWSFAILYYIGKLVIQVFIVWGMQLKGEMFEFVPKFGQDFGFMAITLMASRFLNSSSPQELPYTLSQFFFFLIIVAFFAFTYWVYLYQKRLGNEEQRNRTLIGRYLASPLSILIARFALSSLTFALGLYAFCVVVITFEPNVGTNAVFNEEIFSLFLPVFLVGIVIIIASYFMQSRIFRTRQAIWKLKPIIMSELDNLCSDLTDQLTTEFRSAVFLKSEATTEEIKIAFHSSNMTGAIDLDISFHKGQGCVGLTWDQKAIHVANLSRNASKAVTHGLTTKQTKLTKGLKTIVSVPIVSASSADNLIGILSIDSEANIAKSFETEGIREQISISSGAISELLHRWGLSQNLQ